ncbi:trigger factor [Oleiagrimonas sp.]|jgi:trigger factor|uniref:trigger factor n=1 Tax=Oleiagrimonas sp. TaxID=2010330 RepID=UPI002632430C|nr:trigger factor [Oleiagrimonas sp.]MDA3913854.1 trigger factor [Oleiagrimonas sp.]
MQVSVEQVGKLERKMTLKIPADRLESQVSSRIAEMGRTVRLKGFRPGKVPSNVIKQRYGAQVRNEVLSDLIGTSLNEAFEQEKLRPVAQPSVDTTGEAEDGEIACTATFEIMPELPDVDVAGMEIERVTAEVTDKDIDSMIETLRLQRRSFDPVDRASESGDFVMFDYSAVAGDYRFPEDGTERAGSVIGSGTLFDALDDALSGRSAGDKYDADILFPEDFGNESLAGKTASVHISIAKVQQPKLPEIDEDFVRAFGIGDGQVDTLRTEVRANLKRELEAALAGRLKGQVAEKLAEMHDDIDVPRVMVESEARGLVANSLPKDQEPTPEMLQSAEPMARKRVIAALLLGEIARREDMQVDQKRLGETLGAIASTYEEPEKVVELYNNDPQLMQGLHNRVMEDQVAVWIAEHAKTTEKQMSFDEVMKPQRG